MKRTARTTASLAVAVLALAACGGSGDDDSAAAPSPSASPSATAVAVDPAVAAAAAAKINLQAADLPGYTATAPDTATDTQEEAAEDAFLTCVGASTEEYVAEVPSQDFAKGEGVPSVEVSSSVDVVDDPARSQQDVAAFNSDKAPECLKSFVQSALSAGGGEGLVLSEPQITKLTPDAPEADGSFGFRMTTSATVEGQSIPLTFDVLGFAEKQTQVSLTVVSVGEAMPEAERDALFATLVERGIANAV